MPITSDLNFYSINDEKGINFEVTHYSKYMNSVFNGYLSIKNAHALIEAYEHKDLLYIDNEVEYDPDFGISVYSKDGSAYASIIGDKKSSNCIKKLKKVLAKYNPASVNEF